MAKAVISEEKIELQLQALKVFLGENAPAKLVRNFQPNNQGTIIFNLTSKNEILELLSPLEQALHGGSREELMNQVVRRIFEEIEETDPIAAAYLQFRGKLRINAVIVAKAIAHILSQPHLLARFLGFLSDKAQQALKMLTFEASSFDVSTLQKDLGVPIIGKVANYYDKPVVSYHFGLCSFTRGDYNSKAKGYDYRISLPLAVRSTLRRYYLAGERDPLTPLAEPPQAMFRYNNEAYLMRSAPLLWSFMSVGNLEYSSINDKPLKSSLRAMVESCGLPEFFPPKAKDVDTLAAQYIIALLENASIQENAQTPLDFLKYWYKLLSLGRFPVRSTVLTMFKDNSYSPRSLREVEDGFVALLKSLPKDGFLSAEGLRQYVQMNEEAFMMLPEKLTNGYFAVNCTPEYSKKNPYDRAMPITDEIYFDAVTMTLVRGMMFVFAAFGMVEILYDMPENPIIQNGTKSYLSPFDGLRAVRITPLGRYLIGEEKKYTAVESSSIQPFSVLFDEQILIAAVHLGDKVRLMTVEKYMKPIALGSPVSRAETASADAATDSEQKSRRYFKMSYESFLQGCEKRRDVEIKIESFRAQMCSVETPLPEVWEEFLSNVLAKTQPLKKVSNLQVFTVQPSPELKHLCGSDPILKNVIIKAEGFRILVKNGDVPILVSRLRHFGYLMEVSS
jgi:hypothetical protein